MRPAQVQKTKIQHGRERGHKFLPLAKKLFATIFPWERENHFSSLECYWIYQPHTRVGCMPRSSWLTQMESMSFVSFLFYFLYFRFYCWNFFLFLFGFFVIFIPSFRDREIEHEFWWLESWVGSEWSKKGKHMIEIYKKFEI